MDQRIQFVLFLLLIVCSDFVTPWINFSNTARKVRSNVKRKCPNVKAIRNFDLEQMMGIWYVVQYYASSEELPEYACMRSHFSTEDQRITMKFSYIFADDPLREKLQGNITWFIPDFNTPAHWIHAEDTYEGIYNTYVLDTEYQSWALIMHCAEKKKQPRYLSALLLSREPSLSENVINYLREKLPRYDIDLSFMFSLEQTGCEHLMKSAADDPRAYNIINEGDNAKELIKVLLKQS